MNESTCTKTFAKRVKSRALEKINKMNGILFLKNIVNQHWGMYLVVHPRNILIKEDMKKKEEVQNEKNEQGLASKGESYILYFDSMHIRFNEEFVNMIYKTLNDLIGVSKSSDHDQGDENKATSDKIDISQSQGITDGNSGEVTIDEGKEEEKKKVEGEKNWREKKMNMKSLLMKK